MQDNIDIDLTTDEVKYIDDEIYYLQKKKERALYKAEQEEFYLSKSLLIDTAETLDKCIKYYKLKKHCIIYKINIPEELL